MSLGGISVAEQCKLSITVAPRLKLLPFTVNLAPFSHYLEQYKEGIDASRKQLHVMFTRTYGPLYQSNAQDEIREDSSDCSKNSLALEAFGDIPLKMMRQLERSLGAARSLTHALKSSSDILQDILQRELSTDCQIAATQMKYCTYCLPAAGRITLNKSLKPCQLYCFDTINKCFTDYIVIENTWQQFIGTPFSFISFI
ncbi:unnamed protein product [Litomosoides sigmodontis]|uniref:Uncharacterized protein n=1 Tax=Litomosoides sigmodontis TaxID=42156 RepID=A0A3P6STB6_LITSI|nr:unnamed protein product [Litomosoides sigmodontis]